MTSILYAMSPKEAGAHSRRIVCRLDDLDSGSSPGPFYQSKLRVHWGEGVE